MNRVLLGLILWAGSVAGISARDYNILEAGARPDDRCTEAIQRAVDACHAAGGGRVVIPAGRFITGTIVLRSRVDLHLEQGAELLGSHDLGDYRRTFRPHGMLVAEDAVQVSVTGEGVIDARGSHFFDATRNHIYEEFDRRLTRQQAGYMPEGRFHSDGPIAKGPKPGMTLAFYHCSQVTVRDVTIKDTPSWALRLAYCDDVLVSGITILNNLLVPNSDGVHVTTSRNVRVSDCDIRAGDDAFIVTGFSQREEQPGYGMEEQAGRKHGNKTPFAENISVSNCQLQSRSAAIRVGYGQHPIRRCQFTNIIIHGSNRGIGIFARDASNIEELVFTNIIIETRLHNGQWWGNGEPIHLSATSRFPGEPVGHIRHVQFANVTATSEHGILLYGDAPDSIGDVSFDRVRLRMVRGRETEAYGGNIDLRPAADPTRRVFGRDLPGLFARHVDGLAIRDFTLEWGEGLPAFFTHGIECEGVRYLRVEGFRGTGNPGSPSARRVWLVDTEIEE